MNCEGRIFVVGGTVVHAKVLQVLRDHAHCPTVAEAPTPCDFGLATCDGELSRQQLHGISQGLNRWRKQLAAESGKRPAHVGGQRPNGQHDRQEVEQLTTRLVGLRQWQAELAAGGEPPGAPFFLDPIAQVELAEALASVNQDGPFPPLMAWQARVVYWLSGACAVRRYLVAVEGMLKAFSRCVRREQLPGFQGALLAWKRRSQGERIKDLLAEQAQHMRRLSPELVRQGRFSARLRGRSFQEHCDLLIDSCSKLLMKNQQDRWHLTPAALAAIAAADGSEVPLPRRCVEAGANDEDYDAVVRIAENLTSQIGQPGYEALLVALDKLPESLDKCWYGEVRRLLEKDNSVADVASAHEQGLLKNMADSCLPVATLRCLSDAFASRACPLDSSDLWSLVDRIQRPEDLRPVRTWLRWLSCVSPAAMTSRMQETLWSVFWRR